MVKNYYGITDVGRMRNNNEDAFITEKILANKYLLVCVIDGVGGYEGGEVAAAITKEAILNYFTVASGDMQTMLKEALVAANEKIVEAKLKKKEYQSMACVVTLAVIDAEQNIFYYAHVGDTRLYLLRDNSLVKVTHDHSFVGFLEDSGRLTEEAAMTHIKRNEIDKALGFDARISVQSDYIEAGQSPFLPGDLLMLCSDGLTDLVPADELLTVLNNDSTLAQKAETLVGAANDKGGKDNITVVLVQNSAKRSNGRAVKPKVLVKKSAQQSNPQQEVKEEPKVEVIQHVYKNKGLIVFLSILCLVFLGLFLWQYLKPVDTVIPQPSITEKPLGIDKALFGDSINTHNLETVVMADSVYKEPIVLSDTLRLQKDSLHIKGVGNIVFTSDSLFKGPALMLSANSSFVLLENLTFKDFDIGVIGNTKALRLKNVKFINCRIPLLYPFLFTDSVAVSGTINGTTLFKNDNSNNN